MYTSWRARAGTLRLAPVACALAGLLAGLLTVGSAQAQNLPELFAAARAHDASFVAALAQFEADRARAAQAQAGVRPSVALSGGAQWTHRDTSLPGPTLAFNQQQLTLGASQPLFRPANQLALQQAQWALQAAQARLQSAEQDLIVRTAQATFDLLAAQDRLRFIEAQQQAVAEQLAAARRMFEVGATTVTDAREAQARFDLVRAQQIAAANELQVNQLALEQLVGRSPVRPWQLPEGVALPALPTALPVWVERAQTAHPVLRQAEAGLQIAELEVQRAQAARGPTVDATAQLQLARSPNPALPASGHVRQRDASVGIQFNLPLYSGGALQNRIAEAVALHTRARAELDAAQRSVTQATRSAYLGVASGIGQVQALQAAQASSQSALEANRLGLEVGVRINLDVLNAQSQLFDTKTQLARARYEVLLGSLRLRQASGVLSADDLQPIAALLRAPQPNH
ncbi:MAG: TolC family outer membrane protein [Pseudomonadota bacterium]